MSKENAKNRLLGKFPTTQKGIWEVRAEDENCDLAGPHHQKLLGYYEGEYGHIVDFALELPGFFAWGYGGDVKEVKVEKVEASAVEQLRRAKKELNEINKRKEELEKRVTFLKLGGAS